MISVWVAAGVIGDSQRNDSIVAFLPPIHLAKTTEIIRSIRNRFAKTPNGSICELNFDVNPFTSEFAFSMHADAPLLGLYTVFTPQKSTAETLLQDDRGLVISIELVLVAIVASIGVVAALAATRDSITSEMSDVAGSIQDLNQSYSYNGTVGQSSIGSGSSFEDGTDHGDNADDIAGQADNCITFDVVPSDEILPTVSSTNLVVELAFDADGADTSPNGISNDANLRGGASVVGGTLFFDGVNDFATIDNSDDINLGTHRQRTVALQFTADDVTNRQVLYEEGGTVRGLAIYIDNGSLFIGGWNIRETAWAPAHFSTPIVAGQEFSVALVLNGTNSVQPDALTGYLDGVQFGSAAGSQIHSHPGGIGLGGINNHTIFHDGRDTSNTGYFFGGTIDNFAIYNEALSSDDVGILANQ